MKKFFLLCIFTLSFYLGQAQVTLIDSFVHGGIMRTYRLYIPAVYNGSSAVPVVLNLHGYTSNALQQELYGDFRPIADSANFIIAHPDGTFDATNNRFWSAFGASPVDDIGFLSTLLDTIIAHYNINQNRIYSTGMSNGGYMSYLLACSLGHRIAAIASVTGTMTPPMQAACTPSHPTPIMEIHGTADAVVPYLGNVSNVPIDSVIKYWVDVNHCNPTAIYTAVPDIAVGDGCTAEHYIYNGGDNGSSVELFKIIGGGHTWPGAPFIVGVTNMDFSASAEIWRFFSQYSLNNLATNTEIIYPNDKVHFYLFPNPSKRDFAVSFTNLNQKEISIFDYMGKRIYFKLSSEKLLRIELHKKGIYFLQVKEAEALTTQKIVID